MKLRGKLTILVFIIILLIPILNWSNTNTVENRTMYVYKHTDNKTVLKDNNKNLYKINDYIELNKKLLVTIDNKGTDNFKDDEILDWCYK